MNKSPHNLSWFMAGPTYAPTIERTEPSVDAAELEEALEIEPDWDRQMLFCDSLPEALGETEIW